MGIVQSITVDGNEIICESGDQRINSCTASFESEFPKTIRMEFDATLHTHRIEISNAREFEANDVDDITWSGREAIPENIRESPSRVDYRLMEAEFVIQEPGYYYFLIKPEDENPHPSGGNVLAVRPEDGDGDGDGDDPRDQTTNNSSLWYVIAIYAGIVILLIVAIVLIIMIFNKKKSTTKEVK